jgi:hypothetical protein
MEKYNILEKLGDGTYGTVSKAINSSKSKNSYNIN